MGTLRGTKDAGAAENHRLCALSSKNFGLERVSPEALGTVGLRLDDIKALYARFGDIDVSCGAATITKVDVRRNLRIGNIQVRNSK